MNTKSLYLSLTIFSAFFNNSAIADSSQSMNASPTGKEVFSGLYINGSVGHSHLGARKNSQFTTGGGIVVGGGKDLSSNGFLCSANLGWAHFTGPVYFAVEIGALHDGQKANTDAHSRVGIVRPNFKESLTRENGLELKVKLGSMVGENVLVYGSLGAERSRFTYQGSFDINHSKISKSLNAIVPGLGVKVALSDRLSFDFNYGYSFYQRWTINNLSLDNGQVTAKLRPSVSTARLGISFRL